MNDGTVDARGGAREPVEVTVRSHAPGTFLGIHAHDRATLAVLRKGAFVESAPGWDLPVEPGRVVYKGPHVPHANRYGAEGAEEIIFSFPGGSGEDSPEPRLLRGVALARCLEAMEAFLAGSSLFRLSAWEALAEASSPADGGPVPSARPEVERVRELLHDEFMPPPTLEELAGLARMHRGHLTREFRRAFGCSIGQYARRRQLDRVIELLRRGMSLSRAAVAAGFFDQSHLCRIVRRELGCSPGTLAGRVNP